jgi:hypothetical protein
MGYRSDVAYVIKFNDIETRDNFVTLMLAKNDAHLTQAIKECEYGYKDDPIITFEQQSVKWYDSFEDVQAHQQLMEDAVAIYKHKGGRFRFIGVGEDGTEDFDENDSENDLYDYITTTHAVNTMFPTIPTGESTSTLNKE